MRGRLAQIVIFSIACALVGKPHAGSQSTVANAAPEMHRQGSCSASSASTDEQQSAPEISVAEVVFSSGIQLPTSDQDQIAASVMELTRGDSLDGVIDEALERVRAGWQNHGYFQAQVTGDARTLTSSPVNQRIAINVHVNEGLQYHLGEITFKHNKAISNIAALRALFPIQAGDVLSREKIAIGLENLRKAYGSLGYVNFTSVPETTFDDDNKVVHIDIDVDEGKQFYVSSVDILGLDELARQELLKDLPIKRGQVYNSRLYELTWLQHASLFPDCGCRSYRSLRLDERAGTLAVTLDFRPCLTD